MKRVVTSFWMAGLRYWTGTSNAQRVLFISGTLLFLSMFFHGIVLVATGGSLDGPISFRKAMTFAESLGLTCWAVGWMLPLFRLRRRGEWAIAGSTAVFALGETFLMSMQVWRGVPTHYNFSTIFDTTVYLTTGFGAMAFTLLSLALLVLPLWADVAPGLRLALRAGLMINMLGYAIGLLMALNSGGIWQGMAHFQQMLTSGGDIYRGPAEGTIGGNLVVLHALGVYGIQLVPLAAWLLTYSSLHERRRYALTATITAGNLAIFIILSIQAFRALPLTAFDPFSATLLAAATLTTLAGYAAVGWHTLRGLAPQYTSRAVQEQLSY